MSLAESATELLESIIQLPVEFAGVVTAHLSNGDPVTAALVAILLGTGALLTAASVAVFGYLSVGALVSFLSVERPTTPPR